MKKGRYIIGVDMANGDSVSSTWVCDTLQCDSDIEDEGRWKVSLKNIKYLLIKQFIFHMKDGVFLLKIDKDSIPVDSTVVWKSEE